MIKVKDLAYVRYRTTDLDVMEKFLLDFGMVVSVRTDTVLYMRGSSSSHHIYITELAPKPGFIGFAFEADEEADLHRIAQSLPGTSAVEDRTEPGGGKCVRVIDPTGYQVEIVHGIEPVAELPVRQPLNLNTDRTRSRLGATQRPDHGPAHIRRLGHLILRVRDYPLMYDFYSHFGLTTSDTVHVKNNPEQVAVGFLKCDRGQDYTDHHTLGFACRPGPISVDHTAYECIDFDDVMLGGLYLQSKGYKRAWGVGRHYLGSQIFDYWRDTFGFKVEHWTDGDRVNQASPTSNVPIGDDGPGAISQWGTVPEDYMKIYPGTDSIGPL